MSLESKFDLEVFCETENNLRNNDYNIKFNNTNPDYENLKKNFAKMKTVSCELVGLDGYYIVKNNKYN